MPKRTSQRQRPKRSTRQAERLFEIGGYWLATEDRSPFLKKCWYDSDANRTRRVSTKFRVGQLDEAKFWLSEEVLKDAPKDPLDPAAVSVKRVKTFFKLNHADQIRSGSGITRAFDHIIAYLKGVRPEGDKVEPVVADFGLARQRGFMLHARDNLKLSCKTISTYLSYYKAGLNFCATPRLMRDAKGEEREVKLLSSVPFVNDGEEFISKETGLPRSSPRDWIPTDKQMAAFIDAIEDEHVFRFAIMELNTWARPEAVFELNVKMQVDFERRIIKLNQDGRRQTNKVRPTITLTDNLLGWLMTWNREWPIHDEYGERIRGVDNRTLQKVAKRAGIADWVNFTSYTFRHYMSTRVRRVPSATVTREERAQWLGHKDKKNTTTEDWYETFDPEFLDAPRRATDAILALIGLLTRVRSAIPPVQHHASGFMVIAGAEVADKKREERA